MNINEVSKDDFDDQWISPEDSDGIRTIEYCEYEDGSIFGYWVEFRPNGSEIWSNSNKDIVELEKYIVSTKDMGKQLNDTPIEKAVNLCPSGDGIYVDTEYDEVLDEYLYYIYTLSYDGTRIYKMPCRYTDEGYPEYIETDYSCETYTVIDSEVIGFINK